MIINIPARKKTPHSRPMKFYEWQADYRVAKRSALSFHRNGGTVRIVYDDGEVIRYAVEAPDEAAAQEVQAAADEALGELAELDRSVDTSEAGGAFTATE